VRALVNMLLEKENEIGKQSGTIHDSLRPLKCLFCNISKQLQIVVFKSTVATRRNSRSLSEHCKSKNAALLGDILVSWTLVDIGAAMLPLAFTDDI
jgi:hypothetical protein